MNELFVFIPHERIETVADLQACGHGCYADPNAAGDDILLQFFPDATGLHRDDRHKPPERVAGTMIVVGAGDSLPLTRPPAVDLGKQYWGSTASEFDKLPAPAWVGYWRDFPPTPNTLRRREQLIGPDVTLNGQEWRLPLLVGLPLFSLRNGEQYAAATTPGDQLAVRLARELREFLHDAGAAKWFLRPDAPAPPGSRAIIEYALSRNYRGSWPLWEALGLFDNGAKDTAAAMLHVVGIVAAVAAHDRGEL